MRLTTILVLTLCCVPALARPPEDRLAVLRHGLNLTNWFRFPASADPAALAAYLPPAAMRQIAQAGFGFVRIAIQPDLLIGPDPAANAARMGALLAATARLQSYGLGVVLGPHPRGWQLETSAADRASLLRFWQMLAPALAGLDPGLTIPEVLNEPVFADQPAAWDALQGEVAGLIRAALPAETILLTGTDWGSIDGLLRAVPLADPDVVYSVHVYDPSVLTTLAAFEPGLDQAALALLPFPATDAGCATALSSTVQDRTRAVIRYFCAQHWDAAAVAARIAAAGDWGRAQGAAVAMMEFGASSRLGSSARLAWLQAAHTAAEAQGMGWALWGYEDRMGFGADPCAGLPLDAGVLGALGLGLPP